MKYLLFLLVGLSLLSACRKDDVLPDAVRVTQEIQRVTGSKIDINVSVYNTAQALQGEATTLVFDGDFVVVNSVHYNLARLVAYRYFPHYDTNFKPDLYLYF